jgi:hypothetical protein
LGWFGVRIRPAVEVVKRGLGTWGIGKKNNYLNFKKKIVKVKKLLLSEFIRGPIFRFF